MKRQNTLINITERRHRKLLTNCYTPTDTRRVNSSFVGDMALDISILNAEGSPGQTVAAGIDAHWKLIKAAATPDSFPLIQRLHDYYEDAFFAANEVQELESELRRIALGGAHDSLVMNLLSLCSTAKQLNRGIEAIADRAKNTTCIKGCEIE
jgi:hypothetical protein